MRRSLVAGALGALLAAAPSAASEQLPPSIETRLVPESITVGDHVEVTVELRLQDLDGSRLARLVVPEQRWGKAVIVAPPELVQAGIVGGAPRTWTFTITAFETGKLELPPLEVRLGDDPPRVLRAPDAPVLEVLSVLPADEGSPAPAPPSPPRPLALSAAFWWSAGALSAGLLLAALALAQRGGTSRRTGTAVPPPLAELEAALAGLGDSATDTDFAHLSSALRRFLGRRCEFPALESTTTEVGRGLAARRIDPAVTRRVRELLGACDGIKFARRPATAAELLALRAAALELGRRMEPPPSSSMEAAS